MKKQSVFAVLLAFLCLFSVFIFAACDDESMAPTCQHRDADDNSLCDKCGESYTDGVDVHTHGYGNWSVTTPATCRAKGVETRTCACGHSETREIEKNIDNHTAWGRWSETVPATCVAKGEETRTCACGHSETRELKIDPDAHAWDSENTCTACLHYKDTGMIFTLSGGTYAVTDYVGSATSVIIPSKYQGVAVTAIGSSAFDFCYGLETVTFGENSQLTSIGSCAFEDCSTLKSIEIPQGVTSIGFAAFVGCSSLKSIEIPQGVMSIGERAFWGCSSLTSIEVPSSVTSIGLRAFYDCSSLTSITLPFVGATLDGTSYTDLWYILGPAPTSLKTVIITGGRSIYSGAFAGYSGLTSITIPSNVTSIGQEAFSGCSSLTSITIPSSVTSIDLRAFEDCSSLASVIFENTVGWRCGNLYSDMSGMAISSSDLADTATAATYLTSTYCEYYYWERD